VKRGGSVSVPCLYESKYTTHVKYLCEGQNWGTCSYAVKTNKQGGSGRFLISDDKQQRIFTVTISDLSVYGSYYWCVVEINGGSDIRMSFQLSVTTGRPQLSVDRQEVTGFIGEDVTVHCHYSVGGESRWCRLGGSCVKEPSGSIDGTTVTIKVVKVSKVFSVTLSGLRTQSSGWYFCDKGGLQMPVHVTVQERLSNSKYHNTDQHHTRSNKRFKHL
uniref:polymeric immunoglobulin receptor-like n=1 Tax=Semicossyphus pulcher TaxID=241346 RepID=UPI0037E9A3CF